MPDNIQKLYSRLDAYPGISESYKDFSVSIFIDEKRLGEVSVQVMALTAFGLIARWCEVINIVSKDCECLIPGLEGQKLSTILSGVSEHLPNSQIVFNDNPENYKERFYVGVQETSGEGVWIDSNGWLAGNGYKIFNQQTDIGKYKTNVLSAAFASCLGVATLFRIANRIELSNFSKWYSLLDFENSETTEGLNNVNHFPEDIDLGNIDQIGCGAVGSCFLYFLNALSWKGNIRVVDFDKVKIENLPNSLLFGKYDIGEFKVTIAEKYIDKRKYQLTPILTDYKQFHEEHRLNDLHPDILLCFANEKNVWENIQDDLPPLTFHATTSETWRINFGRHVPIKEWCLVCRFEPEIRNGLRQNFKCTEAIVTDEETQQEFTAMLPFLSAAAAILVLIDIAKLLMNKLDSRFNFLEFSFKSQHGFFVKIPQTRKPCYVCKNQTATLYRKFRMNTKYWYLSDE